MKKHDENNTNNSWHSIAHDFIHVGVHLAAHYLGHCVAGTVGGIVGGVTVAIAIPATMGDGEYKPVHHNINNIDFAPKFTDNLESLCEGAKNYHNQVADLTKKENFEEFKRRIDWGVTPNIWRKPLINILDKSRKHLDNDCMVAPLKDEDIAKCKYKLNVEFCSTKGDANSNEPFFLARSSNNKEMPAVTPTPDVSHTQANPVTSSSIDSLSASKNNQEGFEKFKQNQTVIQDEFKIVSAEAHKQSDKVFKDPEKIHSIAIAASSMIVEYNKIDAENKKFRDIKKHIKRQFYKLKEMLGLKSDLSKSNRGASNFPELVADISQGMSKLSYKDAEDRVKETREKIDAITVEGDRLWRSADKQQKDIEALLERQEKVVNKLSNMRDNGIPEKAASLLNGVALVSKDPVTAVLALGANVVNSVVGNKKKKKMSKNQKEYGKTNDLIERKVAKQARDEAMATNCEQESYAHHMDIVNSKYTPPQERIKSLGDIRDSFLSNKEKEETHLKKLKTDRNNIEKAKKHVKARKGKENIKYKNKKQDFIEINEAVKTTEKRIGKLQNGIEVLDKRIKKEKEKEPMSSFHYYQLQRAEDKFGGVLTEVQQEFYECFNEYVSMQNTYYAPYDGLMYGVSNLMTTTLSILGKSGVCDQNIAQRIFPPVQHIYDAFKQKDRLLFGLESILYEGYLANGGTAASAEVLKSAEKMANFIKDNIKTEKFLSYFQAGIGKMTKGEILISLVNPAVALVTVGLCVVDIAMGFKDPVLEGLKEIKRITTDILDNTNKIIGKIDELNDEVNMLEGKVKKGFDKLQVGVSRLLDGQAEMKKLIRSIQEKNLKNAVILGTRKALKDHRKELEYDTFIQNFENEFVTGDAIFANDPNKVEVFFTRIATWVSVCCDADLNVNDEITMPSLIGNHRHFLGAIADNIGYKKPLPHPDVFYSLFHMLKTFVDSAIPYYERHNKAGLLCLAGQLSLGRSPTSSAAFDATLNHMNEIAQNVVEFVEYIKSPDWLFEKIELYKEGVHKLLFVLENIRDKLELSVSNDQHEKKHEWQEECAARYFKKVPSSAKSSKRVIDVVFEQLTKESCSKHNKFVDIGLHYARDQEFWQYNSKHINVNNRNAGSTRISSKLRHSIFDNDLPDLKEGEVKFLTGAQCIYYCDEVFDLIRQFGEGRKKNIIAAYEKWMKAEGNSIFSVNIDVDPLSTSRYEGNLFGRDKLYINTNRKIEYPGERVDPVPGSDGLLPLVFPTEYLACLERDDRLRRAYNVERKGRGFVQRYYKFVKDEKTSEYLLILNYKFAKNDSDLHEPPSDFANFIVAEFASNFVEEYRNTSTNILHVNEFLIDMFYGPSPLYSYTYAGCISNKHFYKVDFIGLFSMLKNVKYSTDCFRFDNYYYGHSEDSREILREYNANIKKLLNGNKGDAKIVFKGDSVKLIDTNTGKEKKELLIKDFPKLESHIGNKFSCKSIRNKIYDFILSNWVRSTVDSKRGGECRAKDYYDVAMFFGKCDEKQYNKVYGKKQEDVTEEIEELDNLYSVIMASLQLSSAMSFDVLTIFLAQWVHIYPADCFSAVKSLSAYSEDDLDDFIKAVKKVSTALNKIVKNDVAEMQTEINSREGVLPKQMQHIIEKKKEYDEFVNNNPKDSCNNMNFFVPQKQASFFVPPGSGASKLSSSVKGLIEGHFGFPSYTMESKKNAKLRQQNYLSKRKEEYRAPKHELLNQEFKLKM